MKHVRAIALTLGLLFLLSLAACDTLTMDGEDTTVVSTADTPSETTSADTPSETEAPVLPPPLPTAEDLMAGYTYDWHPDGNTMEFGEGRGNFQVVRVEDIPDNHLKKYREAMEDHQDFGEYVLYMSSSGNYAFPELSVETDPAFFAVGNTFELTFTTLTYNTTMKLQLFAYTANGWRIAEELYPDRGTCPTTVTYTVAEGDLGIGLVWLTGMEPMYIGDLKVTLTPADNSAQ